MVNTNKLEYDPCAMFDLHKVDAMVFYSFTHVFRFIFCFLVKVFAKGPNSWTGSPRTFFRTKCKNEKHTKRTNWEERFFWMQQQLQPKAEKLFNEPGTVCERIALLCHHMMSFLSLVCVCVWFFVNLMKRKRRKKPKRWREFKSEENDKNALKNLKWILLLLEN